MNVRTQISLNTVLVVGNYLNSFKKVDLFIQNIVVKNKTHNMMMWENVYRW